jgi:hypothetical protein
MAEPRKPFVRQDSVSGAVDPAVLAPAPSPDYLDETKSGFTDEKKVQSSHLNPADEEEEELDPANRLASGRERPIETAEDIATRFVLSLLSGKGEGMESSCISLEDDPTLHIHTFRMWFLALGLSCFAAVLGQIFYFRPQVSDLSLHPTPRCFKPSVLALSSLSGRSLPSSPNPRPFSSRNSFSKSSPSSLESFGPRSSPRPIVASFGRSLTPVTSTSKSTSQSVSFLRFLIERNQSLTPSFPSTSDHGQHGQ